MFHIYAVKIYLLDEMKKVGIFHLKLGMEEIHLCPHRG